MHTPCPDTRAHARTHPDCTHPWPHVQAQSGDMSLLTPHTHVGHICAHSRDPQRHPLVGTHTPCTAPAISCHTNEPPTPSHLGARSRLSVVTDCVCAHTPVCPDCGHVHVNTAGSGAGPRQVPGDPVPVLERRGFRGDVGFPAWACPPHPGRHPIPTLPTSNTLA